MLHTTRRPGLVLAIGLAVVLAAALSPAGLRDRQVPAVSWAIWTMTFLLALAAFRSAGVPVLEALRRVAWLLPLVALLAVPAGLLAAPGRRAVTALALGARALAAATAGTALATRLGPSGLVRGARQLGAPGRLVDVLEAMLVSLTVVTGQVKAMLRAREARRPAFGAWSALSAAPVDTLRGFGRLAAALLLRSLERAEALEQARRARGGGDS
jgi:energy-coupling factor transporter transmembrane protein EcfT